MILSRISAEPFTDSRSRLKSKVGEIDDERRGTLRGPLLFPSPMNAHLHLISPRQARRLGSAHLAGGCLNE